ncbi:VanZ family protein [Streptomyces caatingaensis]|uniref:VanZ family protein n=1 Tax=Streptomyces caatingaensis TaxID=1678637 RepID=A0A0K9XAQ0_9ACTN|nr:VanZ family protein [Streptomyces caatingaensis]KNB50504.1 VanZ family protein [Streptomyces caatingaensis]
MSFSMALGIGVLGCAAIAAVTFLAGRPRRMSHRVCAALGWLWVAGVVGLTFGTRSGGGRAVNVELLDVSNPADVRDFLLNILMFVPGGLLSASAGLRFAAAAACGFLGSLAIEVTQYLTSSGRTADVNDLLANSLGCVAGYACAVAVRAVFRRAVTETGGPSGRA